MKRIIVISLVVLSTTSAHAYTYNYVCKEHGKSYPLKVDDAKNTLEWKGIIYKIKEKEDCGRAGWHAENGSASFDFCTATQGVADIDQNGTDIPCDLKRR